MGEAKEYDFTEAVKKIADNEDIQNATWSLQYASAKGDGYIGIIRALQLKGSNRSLDLIFKYSPRNAALHEHLPIGETFVNEIDFYEYVYPTLKKFQDDNGIENKFDNTPKCYLTVIDKREELLVLENLRSAGYEMWNRAKSMDRNHIRLVLGTYAKFHGMSFAMKALNPELFQELLKKRYDFDVFLEISKSLGMEKKSAQVWEPLLSIFDKDSEEEKPYYEKLVKFSKDIGQEVAGILQTKEEDSVITHGDCWCNNFMFKYDKDSEGKALETPAVIKVLDFQVSRLGSPVIDLSYFLYACAPKEELDNLDGHLKYYHEELTRYLHQYGIPDEQIISYEKLTKDWLKYCKYGFNMGIFLRKIMLTDKDEAPDLMENFASENSSMTFATRNEEEYRRQVKMLFMHGIDRGIV